MSPPCTRATTGGWAESAKADRGEWCAGFRPYGYEIKKTADKTHILVPHPMEAPLVLIIFDLYANQRLGTHAT